MLGCANMNIKQCDRCGQIYKTNQITSIIKRIKTTETFIGVGLISDNRGYSRKYDLCDNCIENFQKWIKNS
jgi:hypothetical protein